MNMTTKFAAPSAGAVVVSEKESRLSYDRAMISCIKEDGGTHTFFKSRPPVRGFTLFFKDPQVTANMPYLKSFATGGVVSGHNGLKKTVLERYPNQSNFFSIVLFS